MDRVERQYRTVLELSQCMGRHTDLPHLLDDIAACLAKTADLEFVSFTLLNPLNTVAETYILVAADSSERRKATPRPLDEPLQEPDKLLTVEGSLVIPDVEQETELLTGMQSLRNAAVRSCCIIPLTAGRQHSGMLIFGTKRVVAYPSEEVTFLEQVTAQISALVNDLFHHLQLARDRDQLQLLLDVNNAVVATLELPQLLTTIASCISRIIRQEYTSLALYDSERQVLRMHALNFPTSKGPLQEVLTGPVDSGPAGVAVRSRRPALFNADDLKRFHVEISRRLLAEGVNSVCCVPLISRNRVLGTLNVASTRETAFGQEEIDLLNQVAIQVAIAVDNALAYQQIAELSEKLSKEKLYLEEEIQADHNFEEIIGESPVLTRSLRQVEIVAPTDSTVLIQGETGTGKELFARAIHHLSARRRATFVKLNCAAIPTGLLESELFGHEKGAFTGAIATRVGRFELAHGGTIFLDEIGDIPLELQSKLLRVLQEREFERLGSTRTIRTDVRLIAATNRSLIKSVEAKEFRSDLYYRLNVFPVSIPPLRDRAEDIPLLVRHFVRRFARRMHKHIDDISAEAVLALSTYHWPGNIRELENVIERAVILTQGKTLRVPIAELRRPADTVSDAVIPLEEAERALICRALQHTKWVVGGPAGAAARLGMKRTTLQGKMRRLNITRPS